MSRIDEALRQAGLKDQTTALLEAPSALHGFSTQEAQPPAPASAGAFAPLRLPSPAEPLAPGSSSSGGPQADARFTGIEKLVLHGATGHACIEQYRRVAAMLHHLQEERGTKIVMVASAQMGEGKTLTAANLALTLSESYRRRVLLIDADLRRPSLSTLFGVRRATGLSERLRNTGTGPLGVVELSAQLSFLPGGRPDTDPMAGLTSGRLQQILEQGAAHYDWVIVDTPPVALQPDAQLIAAMVEAIVFVVGAGVSQAPVVQHAIETIGRDKIVGVVLNRVDASTFNEAAYQDYYQEPQPAAAPGAPLSSIAAGK